MTSNWFRKICEGNLASTLSVVVALVIGVAAISACSFDPEEKKDKASGPSSNTTPGDSSTTTTLVTDPNDPADPESGAAFFRGTVAASFTKNCASCHSSTATGTKGPITIYDYNKMKTLLAQGASSRNNALIDKLTGFAAHGGGKQCDVGAAGTACEALQSWRDIEVERGTLNDFTVPGGTTTTTLPGQTTTTTTTMAGAPDTRPAAIISVNTVGLVTGWAIDRANLNRTVTVTAVVGGLLGNGGVAVGTAQANRGGPDGDNPGDRRFELQLARTVTVGAQVTQVADGTQRMLYLYDGTTLMTQVGFNFRAWAPTAAGLAYFTNTLGPQLARSPQMGGCAAANCHAWVHDSAYARIADPAPVANVTAIQNTLIGKPALLGTPHGGGRLCNDQNAGVCGAIQEWWRLNFR